MKFATVICLVLAGAVLPSYTLAANRQLTGQEIRTLVIGNTVEGVEDGESYAEFLAPNGSIRGADASERYTGAWSISGEQLCLTYEDEPLECYGVALDGSRLSFLSGGRLDSVVTLRKGNPRGL